VNISKDQILQYLSDEDQQQQVDQIAGEQPDRVDTTLLTKLGRGVRNLL
jgi:hypothetical protein